MRFLASVKETGIFCMAVWGPEKASLRIGQCVG